MSEPVTSMSKDFPNHVRRFASAVADFSQAVLIPYDEARFLQLKIAWLEGILGGSERLSPGERLEAESRLAALTGCAHDLSRASASPAGSRLARHAGDLFAMRRLTCFRGGNAYYYAEALLTADSIIAEVSRCDWDKSTAQEARRELLDTARYAFALATQMVAKPDRCDVDGLRLTLGVCLIVLSMSRSMRTVADEIASWCYDMLELWLGEALVNLKSKRMPLKRKLQLADRALWKSAQIMQSHHLDD